MFIHLITVKSAFPLPEALQRQSRKMPCETWNPKTSNADLNMSHANKIYDDVR